MKVRVRIDTRLVEAIYIKNPEYLQSLTLNLNGLTYFKLNKEEIDLCHNHNINVIDYWGFTKEIPVYGGVEYEYSIDCKPNFNDVHIHYNDFICVRSTYFHFYNKNTEKVNYLWFNNDNTYKIESKLKNKISNDLDKHVIDHFHRTVIRQLVN